MEGGKLDHLYVPIEYEARGSSRALCQNKPRSTSIWEKSCQMQMYLYIFGCTYTDVVEGLGAMTTDNTVDTKHP
jgi:hypothetical protein